MSSECSRFEHYKTNIPRDEDGINNSVYQEEPAMFLLKPHTRGYRERKDRTGFADKSLEKMAQRESYLRQAQKQKEVVLRYIREQKIRFAEIDEVVSEDTRAIFLQWIAQANMSSRKDGTDGIRTGVSADTRKGRQLCPEMRRWRLENAGLYIGV